MQSNSTPIVSGQIICKISLFIQMKECMHTQRYIWLPLLHHQYHYAIYHNPTIMSNPINPGQLWKISTDRFSMYCSECDYRKWRQSALYCKWEVIVTSGSLINSCLEQCLQLHGKWDVQPSYYLLQSTILLSSTMIGYVPHFTLISDGFILCS